MAQATTSSNPLNGFISAVQSIASDLSTATAAASSSSSAASVSTTTTASAASSTSQAASSSVVSSTPSAAAASSTSSGMDKGTRDTIIIICVVLGTLLLALVALGLWLCLRRRKRRRARNDEVEAKAVTSPSQVDDWHHGNNSHHGYVGAGHIPTEETTQHEGYVKAPRHSITQLDEDVNGPDITDHPAYSPGDPYTAAGVGARRTSSTPRSAHERTVPDGETVPARRSLGDRRYSGKMPARKPVGSSASISSRHRDSNPLKIDTSDAAVGAGIGVGAAALAGSAVEQQRNRRLSRDSHTYARRSDPSVSSPMQLADPTATSPLSSHPSNPLLHGQTRNKRESYRSRKSSNGSFQDTSAVPVSKPKRPQTPLGFDFGLSQASYAAEPSSTTHGESRPLASDFEAQPSNAHAFESQVLTSGLDSKNAPTAQLPQQQLHRDRSVSESQPLIAAVSRFSNSSQHGTISSPTPAQSASLQRRSLHFLDHQQRSPPEIPERSPHRLSRSSFDEATTHSYPHTPPYATTEDLAVPPRSPKRASWNRSRESVDPTTTFSSGHNLPGSNDTAYSPPSFGRDSSPRHSPRMGPALGHRSRERQRAGSMTNPIYPSARIETAYGSGRSPAFGAGRDNQVPDHEYGYPVYGPGDSGAASSVESWVSARAIPTPWEDNAIRRNSSSGNLRRPELHKGTSSSSGEKVASQHGTYSHQAAQSASGHDLRNESGPQSGALRGDGQGDSGYYGPGGYDASWGEGYVEEPVFEKYGAPHSRRRSGSSGFDPRYGRWTDSTFDDVYGDGHGHGVGEAI